MQKIFDEVRGCYVAAQPEEIVRQKLLHRMMHELKYPKALLAVEKEIDTLPHCQNQTLHKTGRRADIICFAKNIHPDFELYPLLMIECKAVSLDEKVIQQVLGYNHKVGAPFVAIADPSHVYTYWFDSNKRDYSHMEGLLGFTELVNAITKGDCHAHLS